MDATADATDSRAVVAIGLGSSSTLDCESEVRVVCGVKVFSGEGERAEEVRSTGGNRTFGHYGGDQY